MRDFIENPLLAAEAASVLADMADELAAHPENSTPGDMRAFILTEVGRFLLTHPLDCPAQVSARQTAGGDGGMTGALERLPRAADRRRSGYL